MKNPYLHRWPITKATFGGVFQCMGEYRIENAKHVLHISWGKGRVNLIFLSDIDGDMS